MSESSAICTSGSARDQFLRRVPGALDLPLGTCHTVPSIELIRVRSVTASTDPVAAPTSTQSPTPN
jgi:hypothetical protein